MTKAIETLSAADSIALQQALRPHIIAVLQAAGIIAGGPQGVQLYIQAEQPAAPGPYLWIQPVSGSFAFWIEE